jgi:hypothetical protein
MFNALHFAFGPHDLQIMKAMTNEAIVDADKGKDNCTAMADWLSLNLIRGLVAELPGMLCAFSAFMVVMTAES